MLPSLKYLDGFDCNDVEAPSEGDDDDEGDDEEGEEANGADSDDGEFFFINFRRWRFFQVFFYCLLSSK